MTPSELEQAARDYYNAVGDPHFSSNMIMTIIYQACMEMSLEAMVIERTYTTTSTSGIREITLPTNAFSIRRIEYKGIKLEPVSLDCDPKTSTTEVSGRPAQYALWDGEIILYPTPDTTGDTIEVFTYNRPQSITSSSVLEVPEEYHLDILNLIISIMYAKDQNQSMATYYRNLWEKSLNRIKRQNMKKKSGDQFVVVRDKDYYNGGFTF